MQVGKPADADRCAAVTLVDLDDFLTSCRRRGAEWGLLRHSAIAAPIVELAAEHRAARCSEVPPDEWLITFEGPDADSVRAQAVEMAHAVRRLAHAQSRGGVTISVSNPFAGGQAAECAARQARELIGYKLVTGGDTIICDPPARRSGPEISDETRSALATAARLRDRSRLVTLLMGLCSGVGPADLPGTVTALLLTVLDSGCAPRRRDGGTDWLTSGGYLARLRLADLSTLHEVSNLGRWLDLAVADLFQMLPEMATGPVERAEAYMRVHYDDPNLTLTAVARYAHVSLYYLAHLFSRERGTTYRRTLTAIRMRAASGMLTDGALSVAQVARAVGFSSAKQFRIVFRQAFGCSPTAFRAARSPASGATGPL